MRVEVIVQTSVCSNALLDFDVLIFNVKLESFQFPTAANLIEILFHVNTIATEINNCM